MSSRSRRAEKTKTILMSGMVYDQGKSGISEYTRQLVLQLCEPYEVELVMLERDAREFPISHPRLRLRRASNLFSIPVLNILWHVLVLPWILLNRKYHWVVLPAVNRRCGLWYPKPSLGIIHDLSQYSITHKYDGFRTWYVKHLLPKCVSRLGRVIAISHNTKNDVVRHWGLEADQISVAYNGYDKKAFNKQLPVNFDSVLGKYHLDAGYFLYVSRIEHPGKNHTRLIQAFDSLPPHIVKNRKLVFVGSDWTGAKKVREQASKSKRRDHIRFLGFVPDSELPALYHGAGLMVFPSLYEGFGIPLVEAMACGVPSVCSNNSSLGEIAGEVLLTFDPLSVEEIKQRITLSLEDIPSQANRVSSGFARALQFSWTELGLTINKLIEQTPVQSSFNGWLICKRETISN